MDTSNTLDAELVTQQATSANIANKPGWLKSFLDFYTVVNKENLHKLPSVYSEDVVFEDPMHRIDGLSDLSLYFKKMYTNVDTSTFEITDIIHEGNIATVFWIMSFVHPKLNSGNAVIVEGCTKLKGEGSKIVYHRDYLDVGQMLYENIPVLGAILKSIKNRVKV
jgi:limonene-1,2-epoxide hydrolase